MRVALARRLGPFALRLHLGLEAGRVDDDVALAGDLFGQLQREAVRVVQQERSGTRQLGTGRQLSSSSRIDSPCFNVWRKRSSSRVEHADDEVAVLGDVGIGVAHDVDRGLDQRRHDQLLGAEQVGVPNGAADDPTQHVAAALVATGTRRR